MRTKELQNAVNELMRLFEGSFINSHNELILVPKTNLYFRLEDVETLLDLKCKVIAWCSRDACKSMPYRSDWHNANYNAKIRVRINSFLGVNFNLEQWAFIYTYLGNDIRRKLCEQFVLSDYDLLVLKDRRERELKEEKRKS